MEPVWLQQKERGGRFALKLIASLTLALGRPVGRVLLYPISLYYVISSPTSVRASRNFLSRVHGRKAGFSDIFKHFHAFACTILDRVYFVKKRHDIFEISVTGREIFYDLKEKYGDQGVVFLGSHFGSFEVLRTMALFGRNLPINVMMHEDNARAMNRVMNALNPEQRTGIIPMGSAKSIFQAQQKLNNGEIIGILGDRNFRGGKTLRCDFLGEEAHFPQGPLALASMLNVPVIMFFGIYRGKNRYDIQFELLAEKVELRRAHREEDLQQYVCKYASILEKHVRKAPYNWFNFYDFWATRKEDMTENEAANFRTGIQK